MYPKRNNKFHSVSQDQFDFKLGKYSNFYNLIDLFEMPKFGNSVIYFRPCFVSPNRVWQLDLNYFWEPKIKKLFVAEIRPISARI
jgi:hypothetical protein